MSLPEKKLPTVGLNNGGYSAQRVQPVDYGGLDRGFDGLSRMAEAFRRTQEAEDVSRLINEGLREAQKLQNDYYNLKGTDKANDFSFDDFSTQIAALREKYAAMAKTQKGGDRVFNALDGHYTNIFGRVYAHYLESKNAQFESRQKAQWDLALDAFDDVNPEVWARTFAEVKAITENEIKRNNLTEEQAKAYRRERTEQFFFSAMLSRQNSNDYEGAKALLEFAQQHLGGDVSGQQEGSSLGGAAEQQGESTQGGEKGKTAGTLGQLGVIVENLRKKKTGLELAQKFAEEKGLGPLKLFRLAAIGQDPLADEFFALAENEGLSREQALIAVRTYKDGIREYWDERAKTAWAPILGIYRAGVKWRESRDGSPSPEQRYERLKALGENGDWFAATVADRIYQLWFQGESGAGGKKKPSPYQIKIFNDILMEFHRNPDAALRTYTDERLTLLHFYADITDDQFDELMSVRTRAHNKEWDNFVYKDKDAANAVLPDLIKSYLDCFKDQMEKADLSVEVDDIQPKVALFFQRISAGHTVTRAEVELKIQDVFFSLVDEHHKGLDSFWNDIKSVVGEEDSSFDFEAAVNEARRRQEKGDNTLALEIYLLGRYLKEKIKTVGPKNTKAGFPVEGFTAGQAARDLFTDASMLAFISDEQSRINAGDKPRASREPPAVPQDQQKHTPEDFVPWLKKTHNMLATEFLKLTEEEREKFINEYNKAKTQQMAPSGQRNVPKNAKNSTRSVPIYTRGRQ